MAVLDWMATITGRLGYAVDRNLFYVKGGVAWGEMQTDVGIGGINLLSGNETHVGWTAGLGIEHAFSSCFIARIEYNHVDFGSETHNLGGVFTVPTEVDAQFDTLVVGFSYKF